MTALADLRGRITRLEERVEEVEKLARGTDREVADWRDTLNNHMRTLNGMSDKIDLFQERVEAELAEVRSEMRQGFGTLANGQTLIKDLLTRHLNEPGETHAGDADE